MTFNHAVFAEDVGALEHLLRQRLGELGGCGGSD
jgi:hypothetical protein